MTVFVPPAPALSPSAIEPAHPYGTLRTAQRVFGAATLLIDPLPQLVGEMVAEADFEPGLLGED